MILMPDRTGKAGLPMQCQAGLNKGEARHSLARAVSAHFQGWIDRSDATQQKRARALNLIIAAITFQNTI